MVGTLDEPWQPGIAGVIGRVSIRAPSSWSMSPDREWASTSCISLASRWRSASPAARACASRVSSRSIRSCSAWWLACPSRLASNVMPGKPMIAIALSSAKAGESWLTATATAARHAMPTMDRATGKRSGTRGASSTKPAKSPARPAPSGCSLTSAAELARSITAKTIRHRHAAIVSPQRTQPAQREPAHSDCGVHLAACHPRIPAAAEHNHCHQGKQRWNETAHPPEGCLLLCSRRAQRGEGDAGRRVCAHLSNVTGASGRTASPPGQRHGLTVGGYVSAQR